MSTKADRRHYVFTRAVRCPVCGSTKLHADGTRKNGDTSVTRYSHCKSCGAKLLIVVE